MKKYKLLDAEGKEYYGSMISEPWRNLKKKTYI